MRTFSATPADIKRQWLVVDATNIPIGRLATKIAVFLQGKHKPTYCRHIDMGDAVVVLNAAQVKSTGQKEQDKVYYHYSGYPSGMKARTLSEMRTKAPQQIIELAVRRMLPKGPLGRAMFRKLFVYAGTTHPHEAQQPTVVEGK
jgi:large subunit ribosomal protein L13